MRNTRQPCWTVLHGYKEGEAKMKMNKKLTIGLVLAGALLLVVAVEGFSHGVRHQGPPRDGGFRGGPGPREGLGPLACDLNRTDSQQKQTKAITDSFRESKKV